MSRPILLLVTLLLLEGGALHAQGTRPVQGTVVDAESGTPISGATVLAVDVKNRTYTTPAGQFRLPLPPGDHTLRISSLGYRDTTITLAGGASGVTVRLAASAMKFPEVSVKAGISADEIIQQAIAKKDENLRKAKTVQGLLYTKTSFDIEGNAFGKIDDADRHTITETFARAYYSDKGPRIKVIQRRQTANVPANSNLLALGNFVSFYQDEIQILNATIPSPLNANTLSRYHFSVKERTSLNGKTVYVIDVKPATSLLPTFEGTLKIVAETFNLVEVDLRPSRATAIAFVHDVHVQQKFERFEDDIWLPTYLNISGKGGVEIVRGIAEVQGTVNATSIFTELQVNQPIPDSVYNDQRIIAAAPDADSSRSEFWEGNTLSELTPEEKETYRKTDSVVKATDTVSAAAGGTLGLAPYISFNRAGSLSLGGTFTPRFGPLRLDLLGGYSFGQKRGVGRAGLSVLLFQGDSIRFFNPDRNGDYSARLHANLFSMITPFENDDSYPEIVTSAVAALFHRDYYDFLRRDGWSAGFDLTTPIARIDGAIESARHFSLENTTSRSIFVHKAFRPNPGVLEGAFQTATANVELGRSERAIVISSSRDASFGLRLNGLYGEHESGLSFRAAEARARLSLPTIPTGYAPMVLDIGARAGIGSDNLPPQYQFRMPTSAAFIGRFTSFYSAPTGLYGGTRYAALFASHDFSDILWRAVGLPTFEGRGLELSAEAAAGIFENRTPLASPLHGYSSTGGEWYSEVGFGIGRIPTFISNVFFLKFNARWGVGPLGRGKFGAVLELSSPF